MRERILKPCNIFLIVMVVIVIATLFVPPISAIEDSGEYFGTFERVGLYNTDDGKIAFSETGNKQIATLSELVIRLALKFSNNSNPYFDIRLMGILYAAIFIVAMYFILRSIKFEKWYLNYVFALILTVIFCDVGYLAYFNSFYSFAFDFVIILLLAAIMLLSFKKRRVVSFICALLILVTTFASLYTNAASNREVNMFNSVFYGAVNDSENAKEKLASLGISGGENNVGKSYYDVSEDEKDSVANVSYFDITKFYLTHPKEFVGELKTAIGNSYTLVQDYLSYGDGANLGIWNFIKRTVVPKGIVASLIFIIAFIALAIREYKKRKKNGENDKAFLSLLMITLPVCAVVSLVETLILYGQSLISKNLFIYGIFFDMMIIVSVIWAIDTAVSSRQNMKTKYGVNQ